MDHPRLDLTGLDSYMTSCLALAESRLSRYARIADIAADEAAINAYPRLDRLSEPRGVYLLDPEDTTEADMAIARRAVLDGAVFWEHAAAGEATRLKLGTKFLIDLAGDLSVEDMAFWLTEEVGRPVTPEEIRGHLVVEPGELASMSLGMRHLLQLAFDLRSLAQEEGQDPAEVLARQYTLLILNEQTAERIIGLVAEAEFCGFSREKFLFMIQPAFPGIDRQGGRFVYDPDSPRRLHNHGQLVMQETMDDQIFRIDPDGGREYLSSAEFEGILSGHLDKISYNIEDLDYLTGALQWCSLALALKLGGQGVDMIMEIVANDPERPIKGGLAAFDEVLGRNVMIESFQLRGVPNADIRFLNKNFNHYTNPAASWRALKEKSLPMPITVKHDRLYFQPVQGDINFLVNTAFVQRRQVKPIRAWKSASNTTDAVNAMRAQDEQPGFLAFAERYLP